MSIVDLGLVEDVRVDGRRVEVDLVPTYSGCPALSMIAADVRAAVGALDGVDDVVVRFVAEPAWTPERISPAARASIASSFGVAVAAPGQPAPCPRCGADGARRAVGVRAGAVPLDPALPVVRRGRRDVPVRIYEVFLKREGKEEFRHAGSLEAADDELAVVLARETYVRRAEGDQLWLVDRRHVVDRRAGVPRAQRRQAAPSQRRRARRRPPPRPARASGVIGRARRRAPASTCWRSPTTST